RSRRRLFVAAGEVSLRLLHRRLHGGQHRAGVLHGSLSALLVLLASRSSLLAPLVVRSGLRDALGVAVLERGGLVRERLLGVLGELGYAAVGVELPTADHRLVTRLAEREAEAVTVVLDADDLQRDDIAFLHDFLGVTDTTVDELGDVHEALDRVRQTREGA